jgi:hypothetical protein
MNSYVEDLHRGFETSQEVLFDLVTRASGQDPIKSEKIVRGYENEVHSIETHQGQVFIVKIRRLGELGFEQEAWGMEVCRKAGVPVSEVLLIDKVQVGEETLEAMVQAKSIGRALREIQQELERGLQRMNWGASRPLWDSTCPGSTAVFTTICVSQSSVRIGPGTLISARRNSGPIWMRGCSRIFSLISSYSTTIFRTVSLTWMTSPRSIV